MKTILVIEDQPQMRRNVCTVLEMEGFEVLTAENGRLGVAAAKEDLPDLILCDVMMPELDGYGVLQSLRAHKPTATTPFIFLTAKGEKPDVRTGMNLGADDYITKPFGTDELLARLRAALRRVTEESGPRIEIGDLAIDLEARQITSGGEPVHLTPIEFDLLRVLATHRGKLVTHRQLLHEVWGPGFENETHYLRVHVAHIRSKIERDPSRPRYLITEPGVGYRLRDD